MEAGQLGIGNVIVTRAGPGTVLTGVANKTGRVRVYNVEVADFHTYFVGTRDGGLWVHNQCSWTSKAGIIYETGSAQGNRLFHLFEHLAPNAAKPLHGVFKVENSQELIDLVDEAWLKKGLPLPNDPGAYLVNLGRTIGTEGQQYIKIIVRPGTSKLITAFPRF